MASSAAAFVEGGIQDACDDACSICLENFSDADPAVVTCCKHEYHLQCIIEWSQRSKECPMCWQPLSLKDPDSQELLAAVEHERTIRQSRINVSGVFPPEGYELHRLSYGDDSDFEERMMRHLAFVTMGSRRLGRRDGNIRTPYGNMPSQFVIVPAAPGSNNSSGNNTNNDNSNSSNNNSTVPVPAGSLSLSQGSQASVGSPVTPDSGSSSVNDSGLSRSRGSPRSSETTRRSSETFSESLKSRLAAASSRYKESFTKTTKSFRDKLRMRNTTTMADIGARAREVSAGVVRALERISLESPEREGEDFAADSSATHVNHNETEESNTDLNHRNSNSSSSSLNRSLDDNTVAVDDCSSGNTNNSNNSNINSNNSSSSPTSRGAIVNTTSTPGKAAVEGTPIYVGDRLPKLDTTASALDGHLVSTR